MANTKISAFTSGAPAQSGDEFVIARAGANFKLAGSDIKTLAVGAGEVSVASTKTLTASNTLTLAGTDGTTMTFPSTSATLARTDAGNTFTGNQTVNGGTITADAPVLNMSQTWNAGGVTFTGLKYNATDTASAAASLLMDLQVGNASVLSVTKAGRVNGAAATPGYFNPNNGAGSTIGFSNNYIAIGNSEIVFNGSNHRLLNTAATFNWNNDLFLTRRAAANLRLGAADAAAPVAQTLSVQSVVAGTTNTAGANLTITGSQGTGTGAGGSIIFQVAPAGSTGTAQNGLATFVEMTSTRAFNLYNTTDVTTNFERGKIAWSSNVLQIGTEKNGTGTARDLELQSDGVTRLAIGSGGTLSITGSTGWADGNQLFWQNRCVIASPSNGVLKISNRNETDFNRLQFGGTDVNFPALKRNSAALETKLADDSAYAPHAMQYLDVTDGITAPASATGRARIYVDTADGDLKVIFADGTVKTIVTDT